MWYYMLGGQRNGPVDDASLDNLVIKGTVPGDTPVWREGMAEWLPLYDAAPHLRAPVLADIKRANSCAMCGRQVGSANLVMIRNTKVCGDCKPRAVQSIKEGVTLVQHGEIWNAGKAVLARNRATLPARCFKCNCEVAEKPLKRNVHWHHPAVYFVLLISPLVYIIVAMIVRKRASLDVFLCRRHRTIRMWAIAGGWLGTLAGIVVMFASPAVYDAIHVDSTIPGLLLTIVSIVCGIIFSRFVAASKIENDMVWLNGAGKEFRDSLPPAP